jgi:hypothetical protein
MLAASSYSSAATADRAMPLRHQLESYLQRAFALAPAPPNAPSIEVPSALGRFPYNRPSVWMQTRRVLPSTVLKLKSTSTTAIAVTATSVEMNNV